MTLVRFEPMRELENFDNRIQRFFGEFPNSFDFGLSFNPKVDLFEDDKNIYVEAEIPGVKKDDIKLSFEDNTLTVKGEKKSETNEKEKNLFRSERIYGSFVRSFSIPGQINIDNIDAKFEDGILKIVMEKANLKPISERMIQIK